MTMIDRIGLEFDNTRQFQNKNGWRAWLTFYYRQVRPRLISEAF